MVDNRKKHIFVVDDDGCILRTISVILENANFKCSCFANAEDCLRQLRTEKCDLLITDVRMPGKDGIELLTEALQMAPWLCVIVMTSYADIPLAVRAVKAGAVDFVEKPLEWDSLMLLIESQLEDDGQAEGLKGMALTKREITVLRFLLHGKSNKEIAHALHRSVRTIEVHRSHIMRKLDADNIVDLVKRATAMGIQQAGNRE
jgi:two-component system response regulator FixJ